MSFYRSKHVFRALAWGMVSLGILTGAIFPLVAMELGVSADLALSPSFIVTTLAAGLIVGGLNFALASRIVRPRLRRLTDRMRQVRSAMDQATYSGDWSECDPSVCQLQEQAEDELGDVADSYNALLQALHAAHRVEERIQNFNNTLSSQLDLHDLSEQALALLIEHSEADGGAIILEKQGEWTIPASTGLIEPEAILKSSALQAAHEQAAVRRYDLPAEVKVDAVLSHFMPSDVLLLPIKHHGLLLGWVVLAAASPFSDKTTRLLPLMIQGLGLALNNALLHDDLQRVAALDPLTGLYNRRFGMKRLEEELARIQRNQTPLSLIIVDLDHFKRLNDTYGHLAGDKVLVRAASVIRDMLRKGDVVMRYGGEEFIAILPGSDIEDGQDVAERIRFALAQSQVEIAGHTLSVTASLGVSCTADDRLTSAEPLMKLADSRLYAAKSGGRDRVIAEGAGQALAS
ncbi:GGDEF domain-containing protein [Guyparkeria halophila]|uniref:diguanylate cyclase n=1 Tax=Guyparkeria halophila TaxID=47960 RepID=A0ABZ0YU01_9GAMM|nr:GGDEF domain-containing protein [Guyparkeria halophila]WQH15644.1 GGDEF domain-containing protein [Guyparkeria halophila]